MKKRSRWWVLLLGALLVAASAGAIAQDAIFVPQGWLPFVSNGAAWTPDPATATVSATLAATHTLTPSVTVTPTTTATHTASPTPSPTATLSPTATPSPTPETPQQLLFQNGLYPDVGYRGIEDTWIDGREPGRSHGDEGTLSVGKWGGAGTRRALIKIGDLEAYLPETARVLSATLYLHTNGQPLIRLDAIQVLRPWSEGEATWLSPQIGQSWSLAGCSAAADRDVDAVSQAVASSPLAWCWDLTSLVQKWVARPAENHGIILMNNLLTDLSRSFASSETGALTNRPRLEVVYTEHGGGYPVEPTPLVSFATYGDSRLPVDDVATVQMGMANEIARRAPDFVMHLGDMVSYGLCEPEWVRLEEELFAPFLALPQPDGLVDCRPLDPSKPAGVCDKGLFAIPGRHDYQEMDRLEYREENLARYKAFFDYLPNQGRNYGFTLLRDGFANPAITGVHVLALDTLPIEMTLSAQAQLVAQQLTQHADKLIVTFTHDTFYSLGKAHGNTGVRNNYVPILHQYPWALLTFSGDDHSYQRIQPPGERLTFVIAAGGGAKLYDQVVFPTGWPKAEHYAEYSYAYVEIYADHIDLAGYMVEHNGEIWRMDHDVIAIE